MNKKYGGVIERWSKVDLTALGYDQRELDAKYGENLGFVVRGFLPVDPTGRGFAGAPLQTSLVVKFTPVSIETLNTIYDLGKRRV